MDFNLLKEYQSQCDNKILIICTNYNLDFSKIKDLCREITYQTRLSYREAIDSVQDKLMSGYTYDNIIEVMDIEM